MTSFYSFDESIKQFIKYQSLGNDFVLFDWREKSSSEIDEILGSPVWPKFVHKTCNRHFGVGADGVLILVPHQSLPASCAYIFNSDGSDGGLCLNGARCMAHYLQQKTDQKKDVTIVMGGKTITHRFDGGLIIQTIPAGLYEGEKNIAIAGDNLGGHVVNVGNPHFIVLQKITPEWLAKNGGTIELHEMFPCKTNVEFIWCAEDGACPKEYSVLVHERGCGMTLACSSGASAITWLLFVKNMIKIGEHVSLIMPGGRIITRINEFGNIELCAQAQLVFSGTFF